MKAHSHIEQLTFELPKVRVANKNDLNELLEMGRLLHKENGILNLSLEIIEEEAKKAINGNGSVFGVIGPVGAIEAMIMLSIERFWYTNDPHLEELLSYVRPEFRKSKNARALIEFAKNMSVRLGIPLLIGLLSNQRTIQKIKLYERAIGPQSGAYFLYNTKTGQR